MTGVRQRPSRKDWEERARRLEPRTQAFIDGRFGPPSAARPSRTGARGVHAFEQYTQLKTTWIDLK